MPHKSSCNKTCQGFTLIELSIVLVIIGLLAGGVMVGQYLINAAAVRAQISQVEQYQAAVHTFQAKFNALPGDIDSTSATQFGLGTHNTDGGIVTSNNGLIEGEVSGADTVINTGQGSYETGEFWQDLSSDAAGHLIAGNFSSSGMTTAGCATDIGPTNAASCFPGSKINNNAYVFVYTYNGTNWFGIGSVKIDNTTNGPDFSGAFTVTQAYSIDSKIDDGAPQTGNVVATGFQNGGPVYTSATKINASRTSCFDTGGVTGAPKLYSVTQNNGNGVNCVLSFKFQ